MMTEDGRPSALESIEDIQAEKCDVLASESRAKRKGPCPDRGPLFATAGTTTQVRAKQYWRPSTAYGERDVGSWQLVFNPTCRGTP